jgi:hypothetical protein
VVAALFMNIYIVGLNQLTDIDIDKVVLCVNLTGTFAVISIIKKHKFYAA